MDRLIQNIVRQASAVVTLADQFTVDRLIQNIVRQASAVVTLADQFIIIIINELINVA